MKGRFLLLVSFGLSLSNAGADAQMREHPFTRDELYKVTQFFVGEKEAALAVDSLFESMTPPGEPSGKVQKPPGNHPKLPDSPDEATRGRPTSFESVGGITFTDDTLILLSLLSSETEKKVDTYRQTRHKGGVTSEEEVKWQKRRSEVERLPEVRRWRAKFGAP